MSVTPAARRLRARVGVGVQELIVTTRLSRALRSVSVQWLEVLLMLGSEEDGGVQTW